MILAILGLCFKQAYRTDRQQIVQLKAMRKQISEMIDLYECDRDKWSLAINQFSLLEMAAERDPGELYVQPKSRSLLVANEHRYKSYSIR